jgi:predicted acylesterase/phospholipase RssA
MILVGLGVIWVMVASILQHGWLAGSVRPLVVIFGGAFVVGAVMGLVKQQLKSSLSLLLLVAAGVWLWVSGSFGSWRLLLWDLASAVIAFLLVVLLLVVVVGVFGNRFQRFSKEKPLVFSLVFAAVFFLLTWATTSTIHVLRTGPLPLDPARFAQLAAEPVSIVPQHAANWKKRRIGLALSGGGYRAALFHAGALESLERLGVRVTHMSTVSGGSLIGAYYAAGGEPAEFREAVVAGRFNLKRELLLLHNSLRLILPARLPLFDVRLLPWSYDRRNVQSALVRKLLLDRGRARLDHNEWQPRLMVNATDLTFGLIIGMTERGFLVKGPSGAQFYELGERLELSQSLDLADRVAISGAFPVAFPSARVGATLEDVGSTGESSRPLNLADGGIVDNLGITSLRAAATSADGGDLTSGEIETITDWTMDSSWKVDTVLISDAGAAFEVRPELSQVELFARLFDVAGALGGQAACDPRSGAICFSARRYLTEPESFFRIWDSERTLDDERQTRGLQLIPYRYPEPVLRDLVALVPGDRPDLEHALEEFLSRSPYHGGESDDWMDGHRFQGAEASQQPSLAKLPPLEECRRMREAGERIGRRMLGQASCEAAALRALLLEDVRDSLLVFRGASTLADRFPREESEALYRLGRYLVYLSWPRLAGELSGRDAATTVASEPGT